MRILIVGAGIAGLTAELFLDKKLHNITIIEKDTQWDRRGYAIILFNNGYKILQKLQTPNKLSETGNKFNFLRVFNNNGKILKTVDYTNIHNKYGPSFVILRKELHTFLLNQTKPNKVRMGITITKIEETNDSVNVYFSDGKKEIFDLVIGADGVASKVRALAFSPNARKNFGLEYWAGITSPIKAYSPTFPETILYKNKAFTVYPYDKNNNLCFTFTKAVSKLD